MFNLFKKKENIAFELNQIVFHYLNEHYDFDLNNIKNEFCLDDYYINNIRKHTYFSTIVLKKSDYLAFDGLNAQIICKNGLIYFSIELVKAQLLINYFMDLPIIFYQPLFVELVNHNLNEDKVYNGENNYLIIFKDKWQIVDYVVDYLILEATPVDEVRECFCFIDNNQMCYSIENLMLHKKTDSHSYYSIQYKKGVELTFFDLNHVFLRLNVNNYESTMLNNMENLFSVLKKQSNQNNIISFI
jgi:hypothetical protein